MPTDASADLGRCEAGIATAHDLDAFGIVESMPPTTWQGHVAWASSPWRRRPPICSFDRPSITPPQHARGAEREAGRTLAERGARLAQTQFSAADRRGQVMRRHHDGPVRRHEPRLRAQQVAQDSFGSRSRRGARWARRAARSARGTARPGRAGTAAAGRPRGLARHRSAPWTALRAEAAAQPPRPTASQRRGQLVVAAVSAGHQQVVPDGGGEDVRVLGEDSRPPCVISPSSRWLQVGPVEQSR